MINLSTKNAEEPVMQKDEYPYGMKLDLDVDTVEKLGIEKGWHVVGDEVYIKAKAKVTGINEEGKGCRITLQITDMGKLGVGKELAMETSEYIKMRNRQGKPLVPNQGFHPG